MASHEVCAGARKLRRAAEVFADPKVENEVSDENNQVRAVVQSEEVELKRKEMEKSSDKVQETV